MFVCFFAWKGGQRVVRGDHRFRFLFSPRVLMEMLALGADYPGYLTSQLNQERKTRGSEAPRISFPPELSFKIRPRQFPKELLHA